MLKSDLVNVLVAKRGVTQKQAEATVETIFESMKATECSPGGTMSRRISGSNTSATAVGVVSWDR